MSDRSNQTPHRTAVDRPTRGADRNRPLADRADPGRGGALLPSLADGITLLKIEGDRGVSVPQSLVLDHLLHSSGPAFWVDANGHATTTTLARIAPSQRLLDRITVARGFTAYQHYGAVDALPGAVNRAIRDSTAESRAAIRERRVADGDGDATSATPSLVVTPAVDAQYRADDTLGEAQAGTLQARTLARLATYADAYDVPVLLTRTAADEFTAPVEAAADHRLECERTRIGPRFVGEEFETLVYPVDDGAYYQKTFAYWRDLLAARAAQVGVEPATPAASGPGAGAESVGTGATAGGETAPLTASPLLDAWTANTGGR